MDVESVTNDVSIDKIKIENSNQVNGFNGYSDKHKSHKDKYREKEKKKEHRHSSKDKERHSSSSKDRHHSHKSSSKDKDKDREKHRDKVKERGKDEKKLELKDKESIKDKNSHNKDHNNHNKSKEKRDKDKEKEKKDKDKEKDKSRHSNSKDKDREKDKHKHSSKDKHKHSNSKSRDEKDKIKENKHIKINIEENDNIKNNNHDNILIKKESTDSNDEVENNLSTTSSCDYSLSQFNKDEPKFEEEESSVRIKQEDSDEDIPLAARLHDNSKKRRISSDNDDDDDDDDDDDVSLNERKKIKKDKHIKIKREPDDDYELEQPKKKKKLKKENSNEKSENSPKKGKKKNEEPQDVWKWWEEEKKDDGKKWSFLEHKGPVFAPQYERIPDNIKFYYDGKEIKLSDEAEEVASFYAKMLDHDYTTKSVFNNNFFKDWRKVMTEKERLKIIDLKKCDFKAMHTYYLEIAEKNRNRTKEEKAAIKEKNEELIKEYGFCTIDGHKEKIGNFKIEPPGLFRGRGEHPKMGMLKKRVIAEDIIINCSKDSKIPKPPPGHKWKEIRHDPTVTWLASWNENVQNQVKYIMLNPSSKLKGEKDWQKYETARRLHKCIDKIRREYKEHWKSKEMRIRQRAVALYFIDKLALRAGNEKDEDQADTVGCCSLRIEHIQLFEHRNGKSYVVVFDFLGKDSIRYYNEVPVEKRVFKNLQLFMENKSPGDDLFDRLNTGIMNKHLNELMEGLTAKVFRTYNASWTLQQQLDELTNPDDSLAEKILSYNRANRAVAILCNHQRSVPKGHEKSMEKLKEKIDSKRDAIQDAERQVKDASKDAKHGSVKEKQIYEKKKKQLQRLKEQLTKLEIQETDRDENKTIALGTSKLNYLDPRISVAWCKKHNVPIEKIYNKTQRDKFRWAIDMAGPEYRF